MNNKVENPKVELPTSTEMNDRDYLNQILEIEKNMGVNLAIALNEASNKRLYNDIFSIFKDVKEAQRDLYNLMFEKGWYCLEKAEQQKISEKVSSMNEKLNELE
jgi:spore coat protein CotF